jgi:hypothetical protein
VKANALLCFRKRYRYGHDGTETWQDFEIASGAMDDDFLDGDAGVLGGGRRRLRRLSEGGGGGGGGGAAMLYCRSIEFAVFAMVLTCAR